MIEVCRELTLPTVFLDFDRPCSRFVFVYIVQSSSSSSATARALPYPKFPPISSYSNLPYPHPPRQLNHPAFLQLPPELSSWLLCKIFLFNSFSRVTIAQLSSKHEFCRVCCPLLLYFLYFLVYLYKLFLHFFIFLYLFMYLYIYKYMNVVKNMYVCMCIFVCVHVFVCWYTVSVQSSLFRISFYFFCKHFTNCLLTLLEVLLDRLF